MSAVLTIVGSSARAAAQSAARSGFCVHAADMFADADLRQVAQLRPLDESRPVDDYPAGLEPTISGPQPGHWLYTGALENYPELIGRWQQLRPLLGNPAEVLRRVRSPELLCQELQAAGLPAPAVRYDAAPLPRDGSWLVKPCRSAGGASISRLDATWCDLSTHRGEFYLQQYVEGTSVAAVYLATAHDVVLLGVTRQLCGAVWGGDSDFRYCGSIGPIRLSATASDQFWRIGEILHRSFKLVGLFGVDAILQNETVWPVEVNPRYTASVEVIERATGFQSIAAHLAACRDGVQSTPREPLCQAGKLIVWASRDCRFPALPGLPTDLVPMPSKASLSTLADFPAAETAIAAGCPIATVLATAESESSHGASLAPDSTVAQLLVSRAAALQASCLAG